MSTLAPKLSQEELTELASELASSSDRRVTCPRCGERKGIGDGGLKSFNSEHVGSKGCTTKWKKNNSKTKSSSLSTSTSLLSFFAKKPAQGPALVPTRAPSPPTIPTAPTTSSPEPDGPPSSPYEPSSPLQAVHDNPSSSQAMHNACDFRPIVSEQLQFVRDQWEKVQDPRAHRPELRIEKRRAWVLLEMVRLCMETLPSNVPEAQAGDVFWELANDEYVTAGLEFRREDWSERNGEAGKQAFKRVYDTFKMLYRDDEQDRTRSTEEVLPYVRSGVDGVEGIHRLLECLVEHLDWFDDTWVYPYAVTLEDMVLELAGRSPFPIEWYIKYFIDEDTEELPSSSDESSSASSTRSISPDLLPEQCAIVPTAPAQHRNQLACTGLQFVAPDGQSASTVYPFMLHEILALPWDYERRNGTLWLRSHGCLTVSGSGGPCAGCESLQANDKLHGIMQRAERGVHENTRYHYHGFGSLKIALQRKQDALDRVRLQGLNQARRVVRIEGALSAHKQLVLAVSSQRIKRVDAVLRAAQQRKASIHTMLKMLKDAANDVYHPRGHSEREEAEAVLIFRTCGAQGAHLAHRMFGLLSLQTVRNRQLLIALEPSPAAPTIFEISRNIDACFEPIANMLAELLTFSIIHAVLMFDEIALERRLRYGDKWNKFLGLCREHVEEGGREFSNEDDLDLLFEDVVEDRVHLASEATVGAIGLLTGDSKLYSARPILLSASCHRETAEEHQVVLETTLSAIQSRPALQRVRIVSIDTDGEARRGAALVFMTFKTVLSRSSPIYELLASLKLMDLHVGPDDITVNKDLKHVGFKRVRNACCRKIGIRILGTVVTPPLMQHQLLESGHTLTHVRSRLNPSDKQDVELAYSLERDLWSLPPASPENESTFKQIRDALRLLGDVCFHLVMPSICIDLSLSEQLEHLSSAAHLVLALYVHENAKSHFFPRPLVIDIMLMIKNVYFCVAKAKVDMPTAPFYLILLGTDRLETLFGIVRTMVGNDVNVDVLQLALRAAGATDVANILARYPEYYREPRRAHAPAINRDMSAVEGVDKITPRDWRGDVHVQSVTLLTAWRRGRETVEQKYPQIGEILRGVDATPGASMLAPFGELLVNVPSVPEDNEDEDDEPIPATSGSDEAEAGDAGGEGVCELEDAAADASSAADASALLRTFSKTVVYRGKEMNKSRALSQHFKIFKTGLSRERLDRVQGKLRYGEVHDDSSTEADRSGPVLAISYPIVSLLRVADDNRLFLVFGEVNHLQVNSKSVDHVPLSLLSDKSVRVSYQALRLVPTTADDDPSLKFDWRATTLLPIHGTSLPGSLVMPIDPDISSPSPSNVFFVLDSQTLISLAASLYEQVHTTHARSIPVVRAQLGFPYRERTGKACFVAYGRHDPDTEEIDGACPYCPHVNFDSKHGGQVLAHVGSHVLFDSRFKDRSLETCGLCFQPYTICQIYLRKGKGSAGSLSIDPDRSTCRNIVKFKYKAASESSRTSPCSNVPMHCPVCKQVDPLAPAIWKYNARAHFERAHQAVLFDGYKAMFEITRAERQDMQTSWAGRNDKPRTRKSTKKVEPQLVISEAHSSNYSLRQDTLGDKDSTRESSPSDDAENLWGGSDSDAAHVAGNVSSEEEEGETNQHTSPSQRPIDESARSSKSLPRSSYLEITPPAADVSTSALLRDTTIAPAGSAEEPDINGDSIAVPGGAQATEDEPHMPDTGEPSTTPGDPDTGTMPSSSTRRSSRNLKRPAAEISGVGECRCGEKLGGNEPGVIECARKGCESRWFHLACIGLERVRKGWSCESCEGGTRQKRR